jgi:Arc/MetJ-type ribon-helix-helix transcriptional regulator
MKRITISLPDELAAAMSREAARRHASISSVAREAIEERLGHAGDGPRRLPFVAIGRSGQRTTGRDIDEVLAAEWPDAHRDR